MKLDSMEVIHPVLIDGHSRIGLGSGDFTMTFDEASGLILVVSKRGTTRIIPLANVKQVALATDTKPAKK